MSEKILCIGPGRASTSAKHTIKYVRTNFRTVLTILGIIFGITFGLVLRDYKEQDKKWGERERQYVKFGGEIFLRMLKALSLPLILSSVIAAVGTLDLKLGGKVGKRTFIFYLLTTLCAVLLGIIMVVSVHPGYQENQSNKLQGAAASNTIKLRKIVNGDVMMDMIRNMFPSNLIEATMYQYQTIVDMPTLEKIQERLDNNQSIDESSFPTKSRNLEGTNLMGLMVYSVIFGLALSSMGTYGKPVLKLVRCFSQMFMVIGNWILWLAPIGIFFVLAGSMLDIKDFDKSFEKTGMYVVTVLIGLLLHGLVVLPGVYFLLNGTHPFKMIWKSVPALVMAFGTSSSISTLPATVACVEEKHGVDARISRFVLPIGAAMNLNGTALYAVVSAFFIVQLNDLSMDFSSMIAVSFIATITTIGSNGIPQAGFVLLAMLMNTLGLPAESIAILFPVDWILHRFRTTVNVLGDILAATSIDCAMKEELEQLPVAKILSKELSSSVQEDV